MNREFTTRRETIEDALDRACADLDDDEADAVRELAERLRALRERTQSERAR